MLELLSELFFLSANIDPSRRYLYFQVLGGKAFLEHLQEPEPLPGQVCSTFTLYLHFRNQRFRSKPVPCACEPDLKEGFLLEIHRDGIGTCKWTPGPVVVILLSLDVLSVLGVSLCYFWTAGEGSKMADATSMLSMCDPVNLVLIRTDTSSETTLVSSYFLDWRTVLSSPSGKTCFAVELMGVGEEGWFCYSEWASDAVHWIIHVFIFKMRVRGTNNECSSLIE